MADQTVSPDGCSQPQNSLREQRIARVKDYRWKKGQSGNPGGRPKKLPMTDAMRVFCEAPLPVKLRLMLQEAMSCKEQAYKLSPKMTFREGAALGTMLRLFGALDKGFPTELLREIREATEGRSHFRLVAPGMDEANEKDPTDIRKRLYEGFAKIMMERRDLYGFDVPILDQVEAEMQKLPPAKKTKAG